MVARKVLVHHNDSHFDIDYDTDDGLEVLKFQLFSLTSITPDKQQIIRLDNVPITDDVDLFSNSNEIVENLRLVSIEESEPTNSSEEVARKLGSLLIEENDPGLSDSRELEKSDEEFARILQAEEEALFFQEYRAGHDRRKFEQRIRPYVAQVLTYEDEFRQEAAKKTVPVDVLEEKALVSLAKEGNFRPSKVEEEHAFLLQLLFWFKQSFRWVNSPPCEGCGGETSQSGMGVALASEIQFGGSRVELYRCNRCSRITRFPRYIDPLKLLETRRGRCGEWANCFTLYCRAFGYESRLILDFTDHVWTECFSHFLGRWMHLDPCEGVYDKPLLYEKGWSKSLNYVIAVSKDGVHDVTKRYTRKWHEVLSRRVITTEPIASAVLSDITKECRQGHSSQVLSMLDDRDRKEAGEFERGLHVLDDASISLPGRQSGSMEWRMARSELVSNANDSWCCSLCPVRLCVDDHVRNIYNAFSLLLSCFMTDGLSKAEITEILGMLKRLLLDLRSVSFRVRKVPLSLSSNALLASSLDGLLAALSLKRELETDGRLCICLTEDPVRTSVALPVALDALNEMIHTLEGLSNLGKDSLSLPLVKHNRISLGSVLASGEELPFGIATSAFDGLCMSKWEEPNGAKGCWIMYKLPDGQMQELEAYELMSANDAQERDPMDWILEGSDDGGGSWTVLDSQNSQMFPQRFQRKTYRIGSARQMSNAFRLRFLAVRDVNATSRLQIGSIDLYAKNT